MCSTCSSFTKGKKETDHKIGLRYSNLNNANASTGLIVGGKIMQDLACLFGGCYPGGNQSQPIPFQDPAAPPLRNQPTRTPFQTVWINIGGIVAALIGKK